MTTVSAGNVFESAANNAFKSQRPLISGVDHVGVCVPSSVTDQDIETAFKFYDLIGFKRKMDKVLEDEKCKTSVMMIEVKGTTFELYKQDSKMTNNQANSANTCSPGTLNHFSFRVDDVQAVHQKVVEFINNPEMNPGKKIHILEGTTEPNYLPFWDRGVNYFTVQGAFGEKIEFLQRL